MRRTVPNAISSLVLALTCSSCLTTAFDGAVTVEFQVTNNGADYSNTFKVNPNDDKGIRDNRDHIKSAKLSKVVMTILSVGAGNAAHFGSGEVYARIAGQDWPSESRDNALAAFDNAMINEGEQFVLTISDEQNAKFSALLFPADASQPEIEIKVNGRTDSAPLDFKARLELDLKVTAELIK